MNKRAGYVGIVAAPIVWLTGRPYLLLTFTTLLWASNIVVGRHASTAIPVGIMSFVRWMVASLILTALAWRHIRTDWPVIVRNLPWLAMVALTGVAVNNAVSYYALHYTEAINGSLMSSAGPLFIALWAFLLSRKTPSPAQVAGMCVSLVGVLTIISRGNIRSLAEVEVNFGDGMFLMSLFVFGAYVALSTRRPALHPTTFLAAITGIGALELFPLFIWDLSHGHRMAMTLPNVATLGYIAAFPSAVAYLCYNRGIELVGPNNAAAFFHLVPVFGSALSILFLGERLHPFHIIGYMLVTAGIFAAGRRVPQP
ncbi:DMT family transporter [Paracoccus pantotrophus]|uniref:DMT family transporter n=1 Tax=Paracoccus pantotrophus TaxID=82367 RepID=UPI0006848654|nr:DMT family transporter [Paracoccus pantotrophus]